MSNGKSIRTLVAGIAACSALSGAGTASTVSAADQRIWVRGEPAPTRHISTADLNLASTHGQRTLKWRVNGAVRSLCGSVGIMQVPEHMWRSSCRETAFNSARPQMEAAIRDYHLAGRVMRGIVVAAR